MIVFDVYIGLYMISMMYVKDKHEKAASAYFRSKQVLRFGFAMRAMINSQQTRDIDPMLGQRRRRWLNIVIISGQCDCLMFAGKGITWECLQTQETEKAEFSTVDVSA